MNTAIFIENTPTQLIQINQNGGYRAPLRAAVRAPNREILQSRLVGATSPLGGAQSSCDVKVVPRQRVQGVVQYW